MFKTKLLSVLLTLLFTSAFLPITSSAMPEVNVVKSIPSIEVNVSKCNITFEHGTADTFEFIYWATASSSIYSVKVTLEENIPELH